MRRIFTESHEAYMLIMPTLRMLKAKGIRTTYIPGTDVRMVECKLKNDYYDSLVETVSRKYPNKVVFTTVRVQA